MSIENRKYNMSDADLAMLASNMLVFMNRDSTEFASRTVDAADITAFQAMGNAFEVFPPDVYYRAALSGAVEAKDKARGKCIKLVQTISGYFEQEWGNSNWRYKQLNIKNMANKTDSAFLLMCRNVAEVAEENLSALTQLGMAQGEIDGLTSESQNMEDSLNAIISKKSLRDKKAEERAMKGNELYSYCTKYSRIGKLIWENVDEAKRDDYIIYKTSHGGLGKVQGLAYDAASNTASWDALQYSIEYQLEYKQKTGEADWATAYEGAETSAEHDPGAGIWLYRCRGKDEEGSGDWSSELEVGLIE